MDFPARLIDGYFVSGMDELKQTLKLLFQTEYGYFMQQMNLGSLVSVHRSSEGMRLKVKQTVEQIPNLIMEDCEINLPEISLSVRYQDNVVNFSFTLKES